MTTEEFSIRFDILFNNAMSNKAPGLTEYEKSVFLTKALNEILKNKFTGNNERKIPFDGDAKRQADFSNLMRTSTVSIMTGGISTVTNSTFDPRGFEVTVSDRDNIFLIVNEQVNFTYMTPTHNLDNPSIIARTLMKEVLPLSNSEYTALMSKPYKYPKKNLVWRLFSGSTSTKFTLVFNYEDKGELEGDINTHLTTAKYIVRYIKKPSPIVTAELGTITVNGVSKQLTIDGVSTATNCELDSMLHEEILQRAVEIAKNTWTGDTASTVNFGQRSE